MTGTNDGDGDCPARTCNGRSEHDPPYRPQEQYYDYIDPDSGHAIRVDTIQVPDDLSGALVDKQYERCMTKLLRKPAEDDNDE